MLVNRPETINRLNSKPNPTHQQIVAYKCRLLSQLADALAPAQEPAGTRKAVRLIADELFNISTEIVYLEPEELPLRQVLARYGK
jgi:hypothetical protein